MLSENAVLLKQPFKSLITVTSEFTDEILPGVIEASPISVTSILSKESPARLSSPCNDAIQKSGSPSGEYRHRSRALTLADGREYDTFIQLESFDSRILNSDLPNLIVKTDAGFKVGVEPILVGDESSGGTYFLRDKTKAYTVVCKPGDEEPNSPINGCISNTNLYRGKITPGFGMYRECAAWILDNGFAGVPPTALAKIRHTQLKCYPSPNPATSQVSSSNIWTTTRFGYKLASVQSYVRHISSAEDMGPSLFNLCDVQRIAILDIKLCNLDRHSGNLLVAHKSPYHVDANQQLLNDTHTSTATDGTNGIGILIDGPSTVFPNNHIPNQSLSAPANICSSYMTDNDRQINPNKVYRVVPIDHGYCLPHALYLNDVNLCWIDYPQVKQPINKELIEYIEEMNYDDDVALLTKNIGAAIAESSLLTLKATYILLKIGVSRGLTLHDIGLHVIDGNLSNHGDHDARHMSNESKGNSNTSNMSPFQSAIRTAVMSTLTRASTQNTLKYLPHRSITEALLVDRLPHFVSAPPAHTRAISPTLKPCSSFPDIRIHEVETVTTGDSTTLFSPPSSTTSDTKCQLTITEEMLISAMQNDRILRKELESSITQMFDYSSRNKL